MPKARMTVEMDEILLQRLKDYAKIKNESLTKLIERIANRELRYFPSLISNCELFLKKFKGVKNLDINNNRRLDHINKYKHLIDRNSEPVKKGEQPIEKSGELNFEEETKQKEEEQ